jgi:outer membrane lipoprotein carrier protein
MTRFCVYVAMGLLWLPAGFAQKSELAALQEYFDTVTSMQGSFVQSTLDETDALIEQSTGEVYIQRPNRFRWSYAEPFEQEIVADGKRLWVYDVDLEQVTVRPLDEVLGFGPALLLSGDFETLQETFSIRPEAQGWLELRPKQADWDFQSVRLRMVQGVPEMIEVDSGLGQITRLQMKDIERNPRIPAERFRFQPPSGVDVIAPDGLLQ